jgi:bifunctional DNA-binding transcriptional regulator/antitoxin component of YhaV-PrlF toxin-antitoxin module
MSSIAYNGIEEGFSMTRKSRLATVTSKRQLTIPKIFFEELGMKPGKIRCILDNDKIIIEPIQSTNFWDFSSELLEELIDEGLKGKELLKEFEKRKEMVKEAFALMLEEANLEIEQGKGKEAEELFAELMNENTES